jgi:hypothetical protein
VSKMDAFTQKRFRDDIGPRFDAIKRACEAAARAHKIGALILTFADEELDALARCSYLTYAEMDDLRERGRIKYDYRNQPRRP